MKMRSLGHLIINHCDTALRLFMIGETTVRKQSRRKELRRQRERATLDLEVVGLSAPPRSQASTALKKYT